MDDDVRASPEELRKFAGQLRLFNDDLRGRLAGLEAGFRNLRWDDQQQKRFADLFAETTKGLLRFIDAGDQHIPYLIKAAEILDDYLHHR